MLFDTLNAKVPANAVVLFDGSSLDGWLDKEGNSARWTIEDGSLKVVPGARDIGTRELFEDHFLHLEFKLSDMPDAVGQKKSNSGVFFRAPRCEGAVLQNVHALGGRGAGRRDRRTRACSRRRISTRIGSFTGQTRR